MSNIFWILIHIASIFGGLMFIKEKQPNWFAQLFFGLLGVFIVMANLLSLMELK